MGPETQENNTEATSVQTKAPPAHHKTLTWNVERYQADLSRPVITVDYDRYAHFLEHAELSEEQKHEYLQTIWNIIVEFVSLGFGVHPLQQAQNSCGKFEEIASDPAAVGSNGVECSDNILTSEFINLVDLETDRPEEGVKK